MELDKRGFLWIIHKNNVEFLMEDAIEFISHLKEICEDKKTPFLVDLRIKNWSASKKVREYASNTPLEKIRVSEAILVDNFVIRFLVSMYIKVNKPPNPVKIFSNEEEAVEWSISFVQKRKLKD